MIPKGSAYTLDFLSRTTAGAANTTTVPTTVVSKDSGAQVASTNAPTHNGGGQWILALTSTEMTADKVTVLITGSGLDPDMRTIHTEGTWTVPRAAKLDNADVATSTRLPIASYAAPDNAGIATAGASAAAAATDAAIARAKVVQWDGLAGYAAVAASPAPSATTFVLDFAPGTAPALDDVSGLSCCFLDGALTPAKRPVNSYQSLTATTALVTFASGFPAAPVAGTHVLIV